MSFIRPPASNDNDQSLSALLERLPVDREREGLTESDAFLSDYGSYEAWVELARRLKKSESMSGRTGAGRQRRRKATGA